MKTRNLSKVTGLLIAVSMGCGSLFASPAIELCTSTVQKESRSLPAEATQLLREIQSTATILARDAATLESYRYVTLSPESHAGQLTVARQHINAVGKRLGRLQEIQGAAAPWQQQAIDSIVPMGLKLAARTEAAILHLNQNGKHLWAPVYKDHLKAIADSADRMKEFVDLHLELASTQDKLEELRDRVAATVGL